MPNGVLISEKFKEEILNTYRDYISIYCLISSINKYYNYIKSGNKKSCMSSSK